MMLRRRPPGAGPVARQKLVNETSLIINGRKVFWMKTDEQSTRIINLENSLESLKERFNTDRGKIRFLALFSPTCPLWRDKGARAVHENVFANFPAADISASIVWIPILAEDTYDAALPSVTFLNDSRIQHFYDHRKATGKSIADSVGWAGNIAWDIYLFYRPDAEWRQTPPKPAYWMHQLTDGWATRDKYRTGDDLKNELFISMQKLQNRWLFKFMSDSGIAGRIRLLTPRVKLHLAGTVKRLNVEHPTSNVQYRWRCTLSILEQVNHAEDVI